MNVLEKSLFDAIEAKDIEEIKACLGRNAKINTHNSQGKTPLIVAVEQEFLLAVKILIEHSDIIPSDVDYTPNHKTALEYAISHDVNGSYSSIINCIFSHDELSEDDLGLAFIYFAKLGDLEKINECLYERFVDVNYNHRHYSTALHEAIENQQVSVVRELLSVKSVNINSTNHLLETPIISAIKMGNFEIFSALCAKTNLNFHIQSYLLGTPLTAAIFLKKYDFAKTLLEKENSFKDKLHPAAVLCAVRNDAASILELLIKAGADINSTSEEGYEEPSLQIWKENEISVFFNSSGKSIFELPIITALQENRLQVLPLLLAGADLDKVSPISGCSARNLISSNKITEQVKKIIEQQLRNVSQIIHVDKSQSIVSMKDLDPIKQAELSSTSIIEETSLSIPRVKGSSLPDDALILLKTLFGCIQFSPDFRAKFYEPLILPMLVDGNRSKSLYSWLADNYLITKDWAAFITEVTENKKGEMDYWSLNGGIEAIGCLGKYFNEKLANFLILRSQLWPNNKVLAIKALSKIRHDLINLVQNKDIDEDTLSAIKAYNYCISEPIFNNNELFSIVVPNNLLFLKGPVLFKPSKEDTLLDEEQRHIETTQTPKAMKN